MIKELLLKANLMSESYPKIGESITKIIYHKKGSNFGIDHGIEEGGYCIQFTSGQYHIIPKDVVAAIIYE